MFAGLVFVEHRAPHDVLIAIWVVYLFDRTVHMADVATFDALSRFVRIDVQCERYADLLPFYA